MVAHRSQRWQHATVHAVDAVADDVRRVVLHPDRPVPAPPGSHLDVDLPVDGRVLRRSYSVVHSDEGGRAWTISVQLAPASRGGSRAVHALETGDRVRVGDPLQDFPLGVGAARYVLVAGGIGVTPLVSMARALRRRGADYRVVLVGRTRGRMAYLDDLVAEHGDRVSVHVDDEGTALEVDDLLDEIATSPSAPATEAYVCGPIRLMDAVRRSWADHGLPGPHLRFETFGNSGSWAPAAFTVSVPDLATSVTVGPDSTMLDALEQAGVEVMSDCHKGECGLCVVTVLRTEGRIDHRDVFLSAEQQAEDRWLCACVSRIAAPDAPPGADPPVVTLARP